MDLSRALQGSFKTYLTKEPRINRLIGISTGDKVLLIFFPNPNLVTVLAPPR